MVKPASSRVSRVLMTGPLAPFAEAYGLALRERGYRPLTGVNQLRQVARLSRWLETSGLTAADVGGERVEEFLVVQRDAGRRGSWSRPGLLCLVDVLGRLGVLAAEEPTGPESSTPAGTDLSGRPDPVPRPILVAGSPTADMGMPGPYDNGPQRCGMDGGQRAQQGGH